jgi:transcriptional regulator with XRE-family HTH domain
LRKQREITQEQAAEQIGIHWKYLGEIELGKVNPSFGILVAIARAYRVPLDLFGDGG